MKKLFTVVVALFALQNTAAWAEHKSGHKDPDKDHQISVGNESAAKSGATSDMKVVKEKENQGKDEEHRQAKGADGDQKAAADENSDGHKANKVEKKDKKEKKPKKGKKPKAE